MRKVALVFLLAVFVPSLLLAWLAVRSLRDQQFLMERQQSQLYQSQADSLAKDAGELLSDYERSFTAITAELLREFAPQELAKQFDERLRSKWPLAQVGFVVTLSGNLVCPSPKDSMEARLFCADNSRFLANRESAEVYLNAKSFFNDSKDDANQQQKHAPGADKSESGSVSPSWDSLKNSLQSKSKARAVIPQQALNYDIAPVKPGSAQKQEVDETGNVSKVAPSETEFRQLIGEANEGTLARFVDDKLNVLFWYRADHNSQFVFGAQLALPRMVAELQKRIEQFDRGFQNQICLAILDDKARPVTRSDINFKANWRHPFVATEIGEALPHWEAGVYLRNPKALARSAESIKLTLGLLVAVLVLAIGIGSWLIVTDLNRQLTLARQKTDFVSNVSHELKTPLTSIRMFSELLAEGRVSDSERQRSYLGIISAEAARLTRLINNVLDFARFERGEKKYQFQKCDLVKVLRETLDIYQPQLEANGFQVTTHFPDAPVWVNADRDSLSQLIVNLLSNAEKYSDARKEISVDLQNQRTPLPHAALKIKDRGMGVPRGCEEKIFEQFYRAHDSLNCGIQGSGLGLTLARQVARAHGGEIGYEPQEGGGSCFCLRLPLLSDSKIHE